MLCLLLALSVPSRAVAAGAVWLCGLSDDLSRLICVYDADLGAEDDPADAKPSAVVNGTRFPLDPRGRWTVDLWSPATEREAVYQLALATICYRSPACEVIVSMPGLDTPPVVGVSDRRARR
jgi:hypothetical protein